MTARSVTLAEASTLIRYWGNRFFWSAPFAFGGSPLEAYSRTSGKSNYHRQSVSDTRVPRYQLSHEVFFRLSPSWLSPGQAQRRAKPPHWEYQKRADGSRPRLSMYDAEQQKKQKPKNRNSNKNRPQNYKPNSNNWATRTPRLLRQPQAVCNALRSCALMTP